jgi:lipoprotein-releasing system ATP-binding protein
MSSVFRVRGLTKSYPQGSGTLQILKGLDLDVEAGEAVCIVGDSGAGKSTLLHILGTLDQPTSGEVTYRGEDLLQKSDDELALHRNQRMGFVFQFHYLLSEFTARENLLIPAKIAGWSRSESDARANALLETMGLLDRAHHYPSQMSGGEQQRVAVARALMCRPEVLLADEPTGNLDTQNSLMIQELFFRLKEEMGLTLIVVTHDPSFAARFPRILKLKDGQWTYAQSAFDPRRR